MCKRINLFNIFLIFLNRLVFFGFGVFLEGVLFGVVILKNFIVV